MTNYSSAKETIKKIINELKEKGIKVKSSFSKVQDFHCEGEFLVEFQNRVVYIDAIFIFDNPPKDEYINGIEAVMSKYNSYLDSIYFEKDYTKLEFKVK